MKMIFFFAERVGFRTNTRGISGVVVVSIAEVCYWRNSIRMLEAGVYCMVSAGPALAGKGNMATQWSTAHCHNASRNFMSTS